MPSVAAAAAKSLQSCPTLCDPIEGSPPGSPIPGILQARPLEWVAIAFTNAWKWKVKVKSLSPVRLLATPWTAPTRLLRPWDFPGKSIGVGCHCLLCIPSANEDNFLSFFPGCIPFASFSSFIVLARPFSTAFTASSWLDKFMFLYSFSPKYLFLLRFLLSYICF